MPSTHIHLRRWLEPRSLRRYQGPVAGKQFWKREKLFGFAWRLRFRSNLMTPTEFARQIELVFDGKKAVREIEFKPHHVPSCNFVRL